jgi:hypothetical protein
VDHLDRLLSLAPLALVGFALHRNERERAKLLELLDRDRTAFRDERRELINRVLAPHLIPQGTRPLDRRPDASPAAAPTVTEQARAAFAGVGRAAAPLVPQTSRNGGLPGDGDDLP